MIFLLVEFGARAVLDPCGELERAIGGPPVAARLLLVDSSRTLERIGHGARYRRASQLLRELTQIVGLASFHGSRRGRDHGRGGGGRRR